MNREVSLIGVEDTLQVRGNRHMIFYYSGTGNSLWVAKELGKYQNEMLIDIAREMQKNQEEYVYDLGRKNRICISHIFMGTTPNSWKFYKKSKI